MQNSKSKEIFVIVAVLGIIAIVIFSVWFYKSHRIEQPSPSVSFAKRYRRAEESINNRLTSSKQSYLRNGNMPEEEFKNHILIAQYYKARDFLRTKNSLDIPYLIAVLLDCVTDWKDGGYKTRLSLTLEWLADDSRVIGICIKSKTANSPQKFHLWPIQTFWSDTDHIKAQESCVLQSAGSGVIVSDEWGTKEIEGDTYPNLVLNSDILDNPVQVAVYDEKGNESNYVEIYITPKASQFIQDHSKQNNDK